jgi:hypothetical protein
MNALDDVDEMLNRLIGHFVWSARGGFGTFLTMQFGEPHRLIRGPGQASQDSSAAVRRILDRRLITIKGDLSLFIQNSRWTISAGEKAVDWKSDRALIDEMLIFQLDGQKVVSAVRRPDETVLEFDLGTKLQLGKSIFESEKDSVLWTIQPWEGQSVGLFNNGSSIPPGWRHGDEIENNS